MKGKNWIEYFEDYFHNNLNPVDRKELEAAFREDSSLKASYGEFANAMHALSHSSAKARLAKNPEFQNAISQGLVSTKNESSKKAYYIVGIALLVIASIFFYMYLSSNNNQDSQMTPETEGISTPKNPIAMVKIYLEKGEKPEVQLRGHDRSDLTDVTGINPIENCKNLIRNEQFMQALNCLETAGDSMEENEIMWLMALSRIGLADYDTAQQILSDLASNRFSEFFALSRQLLKELE